MALPNSYGIEKKISSMEGLSAYENGGKGSGFFGHEGRDGKRGGSAPRGSGGSSSKKSKSDSEKKSKSLKQEQYEAEIRGLVDMRGLRGDAGRMKDVAKRFGKDVGEVEQDMDDLEAERQSKAKKAEAKPKTEKKSSEDVDSRLEKVAELKKGKATAFDDPDVFDGEGDVELAKKLKIDREKARGEALSAMIDSFDGDYVKDSIRRQVADDLSRTAIAKSEKAGKGGISDPDREKYLTEDDYDRAYFTDRLASVGEEAALKARTAYLKEIKRQLKSRR